MLAGHPGGDFIAADRMVSLFLENTSNKAIEINFGVSVMDGKHKTTAPFLNTEIPS
jgi:hypothetical protein